MNFNRKIILISAILLVIAATAISRMNNVKYSLDNIIKIDGLSETAVVSVSVREADTGKIVYEKDSKLLLHPASTLKAFTCPVIIDALGEDYVVKTGLYRENKNLYLKLTGDPLLTTGDLIELFKNAGDASQLVIDDSAIDDIYWGVGWMWDDSSNPLMPKISAYNVDHNLSLVNDEIVPVEDPKEYFLSWIKFKGSISAGEVPAEAELIAEVSHTLKEEIENINKNSDNLASETLFKLAGQGTTSGGLLLFREFYSKLGADTSGLLVVDASGVSHNDLTSTDWMSLALFKLYNKTEFVNYRETLAFPGQEGTLQDRLTALSGKLWAKTGTLAGISGIAGYIEAKTGKTYCFAILIQNYKGDSKRAEVLQDALLTQLSEII